MKSHTAQVQPHASAHAVESRKTITLGERVSAFLRRKHPTKTADNVAAETGLPVNTIKTWLQRGSAPDAEGYTALWISYGPEFLEALAGGRSPDWLVQTRRAREALQLKAEIAALENKLARVR
jgi:hypothetical protein